MHHKMQCNTETFIYDVTSQIKQHRVSIGNTITANTELPYIARVTRCYAGYASQSNPGSGWRNKDVLS